MEKHFKILFFLLICSQMSIAQITLTSANAPVARMGQRTRIVDSTSATRLNVGTTAANQTWNFAALTLDPTPAELQTFAVTTGAPQAARFPTATLISRVGLTNAQGVTYHRINTAEWVILGDVDSTGTATVNADPQTVFKYPFTLNSTFKDTFYLDDPDFGVVTVQSTTLADAWGNVQTSLGTFGSLRVKRTSNATLSLFGVPVELNVVNNEWWTNQHAAPVVSHTRVIVKTILLPTGVDTSYDATILTSQTVGTREVEVNHVSNAFPSPAATSLTLDVDVQTPSKVAGLIISANGQTLKTRNFGDLQAGKQQINVDVMDLPAGTYQIILMSDKGKLGSQKIIVVH